MADAELIQKIKDKQLVFTVATGRCGTAFFSELLRLVPGAASLHEPVPEYAEVLREVQRDPDIAKNFLAESKLPQIERDSEHLYIETSHLFCKGFLEPLLAMEIVPALLWIRRDHRGVASSMYRGGTIPGRSEKGLRFYLSPEDPGVLALPGWRELDDYQLCFWYCLEIERRALEYKALYQKNKWLWAETSITEITTMQGMKNLVNDLCLPKLGVINWARYLNNRRSRVNPTDKSKQRVQLPGNLVELEQQVLDLVQKS